MSEERDLEKELKEEKDRYERQNQEAYDEVTKGNEELRRRAEEEQKRIDDILEDRPGETSIERRRRISRQMGRYYKGKRVLPPDADIQTEGNLKGQPKPEDIFGPDYKRKPTYLDDPKDEEDNNPRFAESITFETGANLALDKITSGLLVAPIPGARALYALSNVAGSGIINYLAQRIRGTEFSLGELATASGLSLVPGATQAKTLKGAIGKSTAKGAGIGATAVTSESLIDTGELPDAETLATGALFGGAAGGIFQSVAEKDQIGYALRAMRNRINNRPAGDDFAAIGTVGAARRKPGPKNPDEQAAMETAGQTNIFKSFAADPRLGQTDDQIMDAYKAYRGKVGDPYIEPKQAFKRGLVTRKIKVKDLQPVLKEHPDIPKDKVNEYIQFVNQESKAKGNNLGKTITFLNDAYINGRLGVKKLGNLTVEDLTPIPTRTGSPQEIAEDMSAMLGQNITVKTLDNIIQEKGSIAVQIADQEVMQVTDLKSLTKAYMRRIQRFTGIPAFERGHVFAAKNIYDDLKVTSLSDYKGNLEPEIARSTYNIVDGQSFDDLLKGVDLEDILTGNRSRAEKSDPDKVVARLLGTDYGLRESFLNFVYPQRALSNKIPADAKASFVDDYVEEMNIALMSFDGGKVGVNTLDFIRAAVLKKILPKYEALNDELIEGLITTTNKVTGRDMAAEVNEALERNLVNPQEIRRAGEAK